MLVSIYLFAIAVLASLWSAFADRRGQHRRMCWLGGDVVRKAQVPHHAGPAAAVVQPLLFKRVRIAAYGNYVVRTVMFSPH